MLSTDLSERQLLDALPVSIYALDLDGHLTSVHQAAPRFSDDGGALTAPIGDGSRGAADLGRDARDHVARSDRARDATASHGPSAGRTLGARAQRPMTTASRWRR